MPGPYMFPRGSFNATIAEMVAMNKRLLVTFDDVTAIADHPNIWEGSTIINSFVITTKGEQSANQRWKERTREKCQIWLTSSTAAFYTLLLLV